MSLPSSASFNGLHAPQAMLAQSVCALCGLRLPKRPQTAQWNGEAFRFCCTGCRQVFLLLAESGQLNGDFRSSELYQTSLRLGIIGQPQIVRGTPEVGPASNFGEIRAGLAGEPSPHELQGAQELVLHIDGMWCSACSWLIEKVVGAERGVVHSRVLYASDTAKVFYRPEQISPERITAAIKKLGYEASTLDNAEEANSAERRSLLIRMGVALFLMKNVMFFSYVLYIGYFQELAAEIQSLIPFILVGLTIPSVFWCGLPIHRKAYRSLLNGAPTMELLFSMGILAAFFYSLYALARGHTHFYFDTAASLSALLLVGKFIELRAKQKTSESIRKLYRMLPKKVRIKDPDGERLVSVERLRVGDHFVVKAGEKIPADGEVLRGSAIVDESLLTGESKPIEKSPGSRVLASSMNVNGCLEVRALHIGDQTILSNIINMVESALSKKSPLERTVDRVLRVFIPSILILSILTTVYLLVGGAGLEAALLRGITILVIACPCALGMATPLALAAGIGLAAKRGVLVRDSMALQQAAKTNVVVFDKTGTLTEGSFKLLHFNLNGKEDEGLRLIGSLEQASHHPIADAIVAACKERNLTLSEADEVSRRVGIDGMGIEGVVEGKIIAVGTEAFVARRGFVLPQAEKERAEHEARRGHTVVFGGVQGWTNAGYCVLGDSLKSSSPHAVRLLKERGISVSLLSGDSRQTTAAVARQAQIDAYTAQALPQDKIDQIRGLQAGGAAVMMVGDGINDASALAQANVGVAMGSGTELAVESAPVVALRNDLMK